MTKRLLRARLSPSVDRRDSGGMFVAGRGWGAVHVRSAGDPDSQLRRGQRVSASRHQPGRHGRDHVAGRGPWRGGEGRRLERDGPDDAQRRHVEQPPHGCRGSGRPRQVVVPVRFLRDVRRRRGGRAEGQCRVRGAHEPEQRVSEHDRAGVHGGRAGQLGGAVRARGRGAAGAVGWRPVEGSLSRIRRAAHVWAGCHVGGAGEGRPQLGGLLRRTAWG